MDCHVMRACCELIAAFKWSDDLRAPKYRGNPNVQAGHCYVASEVLYHYLRGAGHQVKPMFVRHEGGPHWFLLVDGVVLDVTAGQFETDVPYSNAKGKGFLTSKPSRRARDLARRARLEVTS
jgi:hypothetical protein